MTYLTVVMVYLTLLIGVGVVMKRQVKTGADFSVAGRRLTWPILVGTLLATWTGSGSVFNGGRLGYENGFSALWSSAGAWIGILLIYFIARRIRRVDAQSVPEILEKRFDARTGTIAAITTIIAYITIVSYQFKGGGRVFEIIVGSDPLIAGLDNLTLGMIITASFTILYTVLAGLLSVVYTDVLNGTVALIGVAVAIPFVLVGVGGIDTFIAGVPPEKWQLFGTLGPKSMFALLIPTLLLLMGDANMYQRLLSSKNESEAEKAVGGWIIGVIIIDLLIIGLGFLASRLFPGLTGGEAAKILILVAVHGVPFWIGSLLLGAILSIIISTADSFLLVPSSNLANDIYKRYIHPSAGDARILMVSRLSVIVLGILAYSMIAFFPTILDAAYAAYTVYGASITPALIATFVWPRASKKAAFYSILSGAVVTIGWEIAKKFNDGMNPLGLEAIYPAAVISIGCLVGLSLIQGGTDGGKITLGSAIAGDNMSSKGTGQG